MAHVHNADGESNTGMISTGGLIQERLIFGCVQNFLRAGSKMSKMSVCFFAGSLAGRGCAQF